MATKAQMDALLAESCPWCGSGPGQKCKVRIGTKWVTVPSTLDGESHDARWQRALGMSARVLSAEVVRHTSGWESAGGDAAETAEPGRIAVLDRPW